MSHRVVDDDAPEDDEHDERGEPQTLGKSTDDQVLITEDVITISVADFNAVSEIVLPPEAASAQPYEFAEASAE